MVGVYEIAKIARVTPAAVANWRSRHPDFPAPILKLKSGPVFNLGQIKKWLKNNKKRRKKMATIISTINLKGGVGKTTLTVAVGEILSEAFRKQVLIIDLDPQTNATTMLIGEKKWEKLNIEEHTLAALFNDALEETEEFDLGKTLQKGVSNVRDVRTLDLIPSSLDLIDVQDKLGTMPSGRFYANNPTEVLHRAVRPILDEYDYILIDCPPNLGLITLNGLRISDGFIIPTIPDVLSTYGIPQIVTRVSDFSDNIGEPIEPYGIIVSKYQGISPLHQRTMKRLRSDSEKDPDKWPNVFDTVINQADAIASSAEFSPINTLRQKYNYGGRYDIFYELAEEIMEVSE